MNSNKNLNVIFTDEAGRERTVHRGTNGVLALKRLRVTPALALNQTVGQMVGARIRALRIERHLSQTQLCFMAGMVTATPKQRMHEIESGSRKEGLRLGTLYAFARALSVEVGEILPQVSEVLDAAGLEFRPLAEATLVAKSVIHDK